MQGATPFTSYLTEQDIFMPDCMYAHAQPATDEADTDIESMKL